MYLELQAGRQAALRHPQAVAGDLDDARLVERESCGRGDDDADERDREAGDDPRGQWQLVVPESVKVLPASGTKDQS